MKKKYSQWIVMSSMIGMLLIGTPTMANALPNGCQQNPYHILVNKQNAVSSDYVPEKLVMPKVRFYTPGNIEKNYMEPEAAAALEEMFNGAKVDGITLVAVSGYRSYSYQSRLYNQSIAQNGKDQKGSAAPNESEHRTGLAMDITGLSGGTIEERFAKTKEGKWLAANCYKYGYIIRYPKDKTDITGYIYEPWHVRYVGKDLALKLHSSGLTMEELQQCCYEVQEVDMVIDGQRDTKKVSVVKDEGILYMNLREFTERVGGTLTYDPTSDINILTYQKRRLLISKAYMNGEPQKTLTIDGRLFIPVRTSCDRLGLQIVMIPSDESPLVVESVNRNKAVV